MLEQHHIFTNLSRRKKIWHSESKLKTIIGTILVTKKEFLIQNLILLLFKLYIYSVRKQGFLSFNNFQNEVSKIKNLEKRVAANNQKKFERFRKKITQNGK